MNMTFGEYIDGLRLFHDFHTGDMELLKLLTAIFYRPKSATEISDLNTFDGDLRKAYNATLERAKA
jgi:hypothetical protein